MLKILLKLLLFKEFNSHESLYNFIKWDFKQKNRGTCEL